MRFATAAIVALLTLAVNQPAQAHEWMLENEKYCCNDRDCLPYPRSAIERLPDGWRVKRSGKVFRDGERGIYPNRAADQGEVWLCLPPGATKETCIFILPEGS